MLFSFEMLASVEEAIVVSGLTEDGKGWCQLVCCVQAGDGRMWG